MPRTVSQKPLAPRQPNPLPITAPENEEAEKVEEKKEKENNESGTIEVKEEKTEKVENKEEEKPTEEKKEVEKQETSDNPTPDVAVATSGPITAATAASKIKPMNSSVVSSVPCRFGARCHTEACTFRHPKVCFYTFNINKCNAFRNAVMTMLARMRHVTSGTRRRMQHVSDGQKTQHKVPV